MFKAFYNPLKDVKRSEKYLCFLETLIRLVFSKMKVHLKTDRIRTQNLDPNPDPATQPKAELIGKEHQ
jgi:hypothetical protein